MSALLPAIGLMLAERAISGAIDIGVFANDPKRSSGKSFLPGALVCRAASI
jgi:hypothetical protein